MSVNDAVAAVTLAMLDGTFSRQLLLGESLDTGRIKADYVNGVLLLTVPVAEKAKPRRIAVNQGDAGPAPIEAHAEEPAAARL